jgi:hypothetical protein
LLAAAGVRVVKQRGLAHSEGELGLYLRLSGRSSWATWQRTRFRISLAHCKGRLSGGFSEVGARFQN